MSFLGGKKIGRRFGVLALTAAVSGALACNVDRGDVMFQAGDFVFDFIVDGTLAGGVPGGGGAILELSIAAADLTPTDAFQRGVAGNGSYYATDGTDFGPGWNFDGFDRNSSNDPRLPALVEDDAVIASGDGFVVGDPAEVGADGFHNPFTEGLISGLKPSTTYVVAFFRYGLTVNGTLDQEQVILGDPVDQPDQLVPLGGSPAGNPAVPIVSFPTIIPFQANANPFVLGSFTTNASGEGFFDVVIDGSGGELYLTSTGAPSDADFDLSLVARNDETSTTFPRYNYLVILEGAAVDAADAADNPQALRVQMGQDLNAATGAPVNNANAPFPAGPTPTVDLLGLPSFAGQASDIEATFTNLGGLSGFVYQVWLINEETGNTISPNGDWSATALDADENPVVVGSAANVNTFGSQGTWTHTFRTNDVLAGQEIGQFTHIFLSIESAAAASPSARRPLWWQFTDMAGDAADPFGWSFIEGAGVVEFGTLNSGGESAVTWSTAGIGEGGFWSSQCNDAPRCSGPSDLLVVQYRNLQLPPRGYFYEGWLVDEDGDATSVGSLVSFEDSPHVSLRDVDRDQSLTSFATSDILIRSTSIAPASLLGAAEFADFAEFRLTLSPKARRGALPPTTALGNVTPEPLRDRAGEGTDNQ